MDEAQVKSTSFNTTSYLVILNQTSLPVHFQYILCKTKVLTTLAGAPISSLGSVLLSIQGRLVLAIKLIIQIPDHSSP